MCAVAAELGIRTIALCRYLPSKRELMDAAVEIAARQIELPDPDADDWKQQLGSLARELRTRHK
jgi:AcrR family transcriptional regulator